jgi:hypothetical protein
MYPLDAASNVEPANEALPCRRTLVGQRIRSAMLGQSLGRVWRHGAPVFPSRFAHRSSYRKPDKASPPSNHVLLNQLGPLSDEDGWHSPMRPLAN